MAGFTIVTGYDAKTAPALEAVSAQTSGAVQEGREALVPRGN